MSAPGKDDCQHITVQKNVKIKKDFYYLKGTVAGPFSGPAAGEKPKWANLIRMYFSFKVVLNSDVLL